jgi:phage repressor protein C with HTH and peptisase S24 domain
LKKPTPKCIVFKLLKYKDKENTLKAAREKQHLTYKKKTIRMTVDFSSKPWRSEEEAHVFSSAEKKRTVNPKFYTQ